MLRTTFGSATCIFFLLFCYPAAAGPVPEEERKECPRLWLNNQNQIAHFASGTSILNETLHDPRAMNATFEIGDFLIKLGERRFNLTSDVRCLKDSEALTFSRISADAKLEAYGYEKLTGCNSIMFDFENEKRIMTTAEGRRPIIFTKEDKIKSKQLFDAIAVFQGRLRDNWVNVAASYGQRWTRAYNMNFYQFVEEDGFRMCNVSTLLAHRNGGKWAISAALTNQSVYEEARKRIWFREMLRFDNGTLSHMPFHLGVCDGPEEELQTKLDQPFKPDNKTLNITYNAPALMEIWEGKTQPSHFRTEPWGENPAVERALVRGGDEKEIVRDSSSKSSITILIVPAILAFLPISLFYEVELGTALLYAVLTDIISVLPLLVKGIELIDFGSRIHWSTVTQIYGLVSPDSDGVVEMFTAHCKLKPEVRETGVVFLVTAVMFTTVGILLEFVSTKMLVRFKSKFFKGDGAFWGLSSPQAQSHTEVRPSPNAGLWWYLANKNKNKDENRLRPHPNHARSVMEDAFL